MNSVICLCSSCHLVSVLSALQTRSIYCFNKAIYGTMSFLISIESMGCKFEVLDCFTQILQNICNCVPIDIVLHPK